MTTEPLKLGLDASALAASKPPTGVQRYLAGLVKQLALRAESDNLELYLYFIKPVPAEKQRPGTPLASALPGPRIKWRIAPIARAWQRVGMGIAMQIDKLDVFHFPSPLMARYCPVASVVTIHDLVALSLHADEIQKERRYLPAALDAGRRATSLIAVSQSTQKEIAQHLGRMDTVVVPEGVDISQFTSAVPPLMEAIRQRYSLDRYILCVGTLQTRKNHLGLIQAFERIQSEIPHALVLAGGDGSGADAIKAYLASKPNPRIRLLGYVEESVLPALYSGADVLALPSLWEGFGLPLIEAMACGTPVLTSNISSLSEVAEGAALLVDPRDVDNISHNLLRLVKESALRQQLIAEGYQRARMYSWQHTAEQTIAVYRDTVRKSHKH